ncbi:MAG TPA: hypothetical protein V6D19_00260 [Stenomitos sp.]
MQNSNRFVSVRPGVGATKVTKVNSAQDLRGLSTVGIKDMPRVLAQQTSDPVSPSTSPSNGLPATDPLSPSSPTDPSSPISPTDPSNPSSTPDSTNPSPSTEPLAPTETTPGTQLPDTQVPSAPSSSEQQFPSSEQIAPNPENVDPGRRTRSGYSYIGIGANVGGFGNTSVGKPGLMLYSKVGLTRYFSIRPGIVTDFSDDATFILPATFDLAPIRLGSVADNAISIAPYIGAGATVTTDGDARPLLTGGLDVPINRRFTATLGINTTFGSDIDLGGFVGVGYNF